LKKRGAKAGIARFLPLAFSVFNFSTRRSAPLFPHFQLFNPSPLRLFNPTFGPAVFSFSTLQPFLSSTFQPDVQPRCFLIFNSSTFPFFNFSTLPVLLDIDFLKFQPMLQLSKSDGRRTVFDPIRRRNVVLTPEELLRQLVLLYLLEEKKYAPGRVRVEMGLEVNGLQKRCDLLVFDAALRPWLLVECKSPKVSLTQAVFEQVARYNLPLQVPFLAVTNGLATAVSALDYEAKAFSFLTDFPDFG
jgi:Type I restriction enzyme R protein N terminus (HSDR_N)